MQILNNKSKKEDVEDEKLNIQVPEKESELDILNKLFHAQNSRSILYVMYKTEKSFQKKHCEYLETHMRNDEWLKSVKALYSNKKQIQEIKGFLTLEVDTKVIEAAKKVSKNFLGYEGKKYIEERRKALNKKELKDQAILTKNIQNHHLKDSILAYCQVETLISLGYLSKLESGAETSIINSTPWQTIPWVTVSYITKQPVVTVTYKTVGTALKNLKVAFNSELVENKVVKKRQKHYTIYKLTKSGIDYGNKLFDKNKVLGDLIDCDYSLEIEKAKTKKIMKEIRGNEYRTIYRTDKDVDKRFKSIENRLENFLWLYYPQAESDDKEIPPIKKILQERAEQLKIINSIKQIRPKKGEKIIKLIDFLKDFYRIKLDIEVIKEDLKSVLSQLDDDLLSIEIIQSEIKALNIMKLEKKKVADISNRTPEIINSIYKGSKNERMKNFLENEKHDKKELNYYYPLILNYESTTERIYIHLHNVRVFLEGLE